ncbi:hypothetical protein EE612_053168 [Oryza sativa]|nr:hypothetical protein EE612_053168 [Oryza sativa]
MRGVRVYFLFIGKKICKSFHQSILSPQLKRVKFGTIRKLKIQVNCTAKIPVGMECFVYNITCYNNQIDRKT